jgi:hypothetical protein
MSIVAYADDEGIPGWFSRISRGLRILEQE